MRDVDGDTTFSRDRAISKEQVNSLETIKELINQYCPNIEYEVSGKDIIFYYSIHEHYLVNARCQKTEHLIDCLKEIALLK